MGQLRLKSKVAAHQQLLCPPPPPEGCAYPRGEGGGGVIWRTHPPPGQTTPPPKPKQMVLWGKMKEPKKEGPILGTQNVFAIIAPPPPPQRHGQQPISGQPTPGVVKQDKSSGGSVDTTKTRSDPQRVRMSSGERPIGAAKRKQPNTEALCPPPPPPVP